MSEERLTREEWKKQEQDAYCRMYGHSWEIIATLSKPVALVCECGVRYIVAEVADAGT